LAALSMTVPIGGGESDAVVDACLALPDKILSDNSKVGGGGD